MRAGGYCRCRYSQASAVLYDPLAEAVPEPGLLEATVDKGAPLTPTAATASATAPCSLLGQAAVVRDLGQHGQVMG